MANIGVHGAPTTLHLEELWIKNITITTGLVSGSTVPTLLKLARDGRIEAEKLGTHHFALDEIEQAYDVFAAAGEHDALKVVLQPRSHFNNGHGSQPSESRVTNSVSVCATRDGA